MSSLDEGERTTVQLHRRQFTLGPAPIAAVSDWRSEQLAPDVWLSYCPDLPVHYSRDRNGSLWAILGTPADTVRRVQPLPEIVDSWVGWPSDAERYDPTATWTGRWALVSGEAVVPDATAQLGIFYGRHTNGEVWISSSPALLATVAEDHDFFFTPPPRVDRGLPWWPPPLGPGAAVHRLLPSQVLSPTDAAVRSRPLLGPTTGLDREARAKAFMDGLSIGIAELSSQLPEPLELEVAMSAGPHARIVLGATDQAGIDYATHTNLREDSPLADEVIPPLLAAVLGRVHREERLPDDPEARRQLLWEHSGPAVSSGDTTCVRTGSGDVLQGITIDGHGAGTAHEFLADLPEPVNTSGLDVFAEHVAGIFDVPAGDRMLEGLHEWLRWGDEHPQDMLWRDRFQLEQVLAGRLGAANQSADLQALHRVSPFNSARLRRLLFGDRPTRHGEALSLQELLRWGPPELMELPLDPSAEELRAIAAPDETDLEVAAITTDAVTTDKAAADAVATDDGAESATVDLTTVDVTTTVDLTETIDLTELPR